MNCSTKRRRKTSRAAKVDHNLPTLVDRINAEHEACFAAANRALDHALRCGELLIEAKDACTHGAWQQWLADNFRGSDRTARAYMRIADHREVIEAKRQTTADLTIQNALHYIAPKREKVIAPDPDELRKQEQRVEDGLAELVLEFEDMVNTADAFGTPHEEAYKAFYPDAGNGVDEVPTFEQHQVDIENWRSAEWFPDALARVRKRRDTPVDHALLVSDAEDRIRKIFARWPTHFAKDIRVVLTALLQEDQTTWIQQGDCMGGGRDDD